MLQKNKNVNGRIVSAPRIHGQWDYKTICAILSGLALLITYVCFNTADTPIFGGFLRVVGWLFFLIAIALLTPIINSLFKSKLINQLSLTEVIHSGPLSIK